MSSFSKNDNLYDELRLFSLLEKVHGLSMTQIGHTLRDSASQKSYFYTIVIIYIALLLLFFSNLMRGAYKFFISNGYLYFALIGSDFILNKFFFILTLIVSHVKRAQKIQFINRISGIDVIIFRKFGRIIDNNQLRFSIFPVTVLWCFIVLFSVLGFIKLSKHEALDSYSIKIAPILLYLEYTVYMTISFGYIICVSLVKYRFQCITSIVNDIQSANISASPIKVEMLLFVYKELISLMDLINEFLGLLICLRIVHDSVLGLISTYVMLGMFLERNSSWMSLAKTGMFLMHNIFKLFMVILSADICMNEVRTRFFLLWFK